MLLQKKKEKMSKVLQFINRSIKEKNINTAKIERALDMINNFWK